MKQSIVKISLPDGKVVDYPSGVKGTEIASDISMSLAKAAIAVRLNSKLCDLNEQIFEDSGVEIVTLNDDSPDVVDLIRHDTAHLLAEAAKEIFGDKIQVTIGPAIEDGFYYDFANLKPFTPEDLISLEKKMLEIIDRNEPIEKMIWSRKEAIKYFKEIGEYYKAEIIRDLPKDEEISVYKQGKFIDLCRGPHLPSTGKAPKAFKLTKLAGAYWRGDHNKPMLQRVYGTAWKKREDLKGYLYRIEEAEKRDHRKIGKEMDLFHFQEEAPGAVFWHPKGWVLFQSLISYMQKKQQIAGYLEINTPDIMDRSLWEESGHWDKFGENMFTTEAKEEKIYALKPMNCPGGIQVYKQGLKSYRDLPLRMSEFGKVHRYEPSGALHGLMRVRAFTQDDAHIFCTEDQITEESIKVCDLIIEIYKDFGFDNIAIKFSDRPIKRVGSDAIWEKSEIALKTAVEETGLKYSYNPGEGAFYGPKLEFVLRDAIGRDWQCGTLQVDLNLPSRLAAFYIGDDGQKHHPVMLHRALFGSLERFSGILLEHYAGHLPLWLSPVQSVITTITSKADKYAETVYSKLVSIGLRVKTDIRNEKLSYKIREHSLSKIPVIIILGERESQEGSVTLRRLGNNKQTTITLDEASAMLCQEAKIPL